MLDKLYMDDIILNALKEDMSLGDLTTDHLVDESTVGEAVFIARNTSIIAGLDLAARVFELIDPKIVFEKKAKDGDRVSQGDIFAKVRGSARTILKGERTALNFLQRLSGVATITRAFVQKVEGLPVRIVDTRKTTPGLRYLEKYAVKAGGGHNHRFSLSDGVLIKDNHIVACGGITKAIQTARKHIPHTIKIEVETESLEQVQEALDAGAEIIMLDNMNFEQMEQAVKLIQHRAIVEASGDVCLENVYDVARTGVDIISIGSITHSVKAANISLKFIESHNI